MKPLKSPYSKMYLVSPGVYDKLLTCLDEKDKKSTELLNLEKEREDRPGEKVIEDITTGDFIPQQMDAATQIEEQQQVQEFIPPTPEVFGVEQQVQPQDIIEEGEITEPMQVPPGEPEIIQQEPNPLRTQCPIPTDPSQVVKQPIFIPSLVKKGVKRTSQPIISKLNKQPTFLAKKKLITPQIIRQQQPIEQIQNPAIGRVQQDDQIEQDIAMPSTSRAQPIKVKSPKKSTLCPICMKVFPRTWNLVRHLSTVHQNLGSVKDILESKVAIQQPIVQQPTTPAKVIVQNPPIVVKPRVGFKFARDVDAPMIEDTKTFETWIKPGKRKSVEAKLLTKPPIIRVKRGHVKATPQDEQEKYEFESWN